MKNWLRQHVLVWVIGIIAFLPFSFTLFNPFVSDDWDFLYAAEHKGFSLSQIFSTNNEGNDVGGSYRPMVVVFWRGLYQIAHLNPFLYHLSTTTLHVANVVLLFFVIKRICKNVPTQNRIAGIASILFAISPSRGELAWISVVNDSLVVFFVLVTVFLFLRFLETEGRLRRYTLFGLSLVSTFCAFFTKEIALIIPPTIFFLTFFAQYPKSQSFFTKIIHATLITIPYFFIVVVFFALRYHVIGLLFADYTGNVTLSIYHIIRGFVSYTFGFFLSGWVRTQVTYFFITHFSLFAVVFCAVLVPCVYLLRRSKFFIPVFFSFILYLFSIVPVIRFAINTTSEYISEEGQRYIYLPSVFLCFCIAAVLSYGYDVVQQNKRSYLIIGGVLCGIFLYGQLWYTIFIWNQSSQLAQHLVQQAVTIIEGGVYDGYVVVGLPEQYRGAPIFRNAFELALSLSLKDSKIPFTRLIVTRNRTLYHPDDRFFISRVDANSFNYMSPYPYERISSAPHFLSSDYETILYGHKRLPYAVSVFDVGRELTLTFSPTFVSYNKEQGNRIAVLFFDTSKWTVLPLGE